MSPCVLCVFNTCQEYSFSSVIFLCLEKCSLFFIGLNTPGKLCVSCFFYVNVNVVRKASNEVTDLQVLGIIECDYLKIIMSKVETRFSSLNILHIFLGKNCHTFSHTLRVNPVNP